MWVQAITFVGAHSSQIRPRHSAARASGHRSKSRQSRSPRAAGKFPNGGGESVESRSNHEIPLISYGRTRAVLGDSAQLRR